MTEWTKDAKAVRRRFRDLILHDGTNNLEFCNAVIAIYSISEAKQSVIDPIADSVGSLFVVERFGKKEANLLNRTSWDIGFYPNTC